MTNTEQQPIEMIEQEGDNDNQEVVFKLSQELHKLLEENKTPGMTLEEYCVHILSTNVKAIEKPLNVYQFVEKYGKRFSEDIGCQNIAVVSGHCDKAYQYKDKWNEAGINLYLGTMIYLLTYTAEFVPYVRETDGGWIDPCDWVIKQYNKTNTAIKYGIQKLIRRIELTDVKTFVES